jgi:hypothetical protein
LVFDIGIVTKRGVWRTGKFLNPSDQHPFIRMDMPDIHLCKMEFSFLSKSSTGTAAEECCPVSAMPFLDKIN